MPVTKAKSKVTRTPRPKKCAVCHEYAENRHLAEIKALDLTCKLERAELERDVMASVLARNLELANIDIQRKASVLKAYERAWVKGQDDPYTNGRCAP